MTRKNKVPLLVGSGVVALISLMALPSPKDGEAPPLQLGAFTQPAAPAGSPAPASAPSDLLAEQREHSASLTWVRNPFRPPGAASAAPEVVPEAVPEPEVRVDQPMEFSGVCAKGDDHWALVDHQIVRLGDRLSSGHTVTSITDTAVTLVRDDQELTLTLGASK